MIAKRLFLTFTLFVFTFISFAYASGLDYQEPESTRQDPDLALNPGPLPTTDKIEAQDRHKCHHHDSSAEDHQCHSCSEKSQQQGCCGGANCNQLTATYHVSLCDEDSSPCKTISLPPQGCPHYYGEDANSVLYPLARPSCHQRYCYKPCCQPACGVYGNPPEMRACGNPCNPRECILEHCCGCDDPRCRIPYPPPPPPPCGYDGPPPPSYGYGGECCCPPPAPPFIYDDTCDPQAKGKKGKGKCKHGGHKKKHGSSEDDDE